MAPIKTEEESDASMRARLVESLSASFPGSALSKALHGMKNMDGEFSDSDNKDPLSNSCFSEIRLEKVKIEDMSDDEELTSLAWLQDTDLLKNISVNPMDDIPKENEAGPQTHPPHVPYNPQKHINSKPPYSFSCLIFMAIEDSPIKKLPVKDIYNWILTHFPYFQNAPTGWKNSVRHNLSLNKCFKKVEKEKAQGIGKGSLWCIDPDYRPNLLQALRKTPYHPYHQLQMLSNPQPTANYTLHGVFTGGSRPLPLTPRLNINAPSPHLFPFLSRRLNQTKLEDTDDIDVANTLVSLKRAAESRRPLQCQNGWDRNGARSRSPSPPEFGSEREKQLLLKRKIRASRPRSPIVCYHNPSEDHTYSITEAQLTAAGEAAGEAAGSPGSSIDEEYDFGPDDSDVESWESESELEGSEGDSPLPKPKLKPSKHALSKHSLSKHTLSKHTLSKHTLSKHTLSKHTLSKHTLSKHGKRRLMNVDDEEEKKIVEGADALLNLAGINTTNIVPLRSISPSSNNNNNNNDMKIKQEPKDPEEDMDTEDS